jgi:ketosteroid isomerase-like protein
MIWPWPRTFDSHDPIDWIFELGRFDFQRWKNIYEDFFNNHKLIHNNRTIKKIVISKENDAAFAVVDVDTLWEYVETKKDFHWKGRACKMYTKMNSGEWKMIAHTGLLNYNS